MFDSLDDQIKHDTELESSKTERLLKWVMAMVATVVVLGVLYLGIQLLDY